MATLNYQNADDSKRERKGLLREWFGPSQDEIWKRLADGIGADFVGGSFWKGGKVIASVPPWEVTLDTYTVSTGESSQTYTRLRAPFINADGFQFRLTRSNIFTGIGKMLGMQDILIGDPQFDEAYVVKSNDAAKISGLLNSSAMREFLLLQRYILVTIKDDEGYFGKIFPAGVDELYLQVAGVVKDLDRLEQLFRLFAMLLDSLCEIGSAYRDDPGVRI